MKHPMPVDARRQKRKVLNSYSAVILRTQKLKNVDRKNGIMGEKQENGRVNFLKKQ
jgi:hypothetical protein